MRLSDVLGSRVIDVDGRDLGHVHDVRLVQDGPPDGPWGAAFRAHHLIVGARSLGVRLGLDRRRVKGPGVLKALSRLGRAPVLVPWEAIGEIAEDEISLRVRGGELPRED